MSYHEMINRWIEIARWAPSADNLQPWGIEWKFVDSHEIIFNLTVNTKSRSTKAADIALNHMALGSLAQNIIYLASSESFGVKNIKLIENGFAILLSPNLSRDKLSWDNLILNRKTHRGLYKRKAVDQDTVTAITKIADEHPQIKIKVFDSDLKKVSALISALDIIRYQNDYHLQHFLKAIRFGKKSIPDGLDIRTLEVDLIGESALKALIKFPFLCGLLHLGLERIFIQLGCAKLLLNSSALVCLSHENINDWSWFELGRCLQKIWLKLTQEDISAQPFGHPLISFDCHLNPESYSETHRHIVIESRENFLKFGVDIYQPGIFLRIGYPLSNKPLARSQRYPRDQISAEAQQK